MKTLIGAEQLLEFVAKSVKQASKTSNLQVESEQQRHTLWIELRLANGETRPLKIQWAVGKSPFPLDAIIYNNADTTGRTTTP